MLPNKKIKLFDPDGTEKEEEQCILSPEITEMILLKLDLHRQKSCRLVCKTWNREISRGFRNQGAVHVDNETLEDFRTACWDNKNTKTLQSPFGNMALTIELFSGFLPAFKRFQKEFPDISVGKLSLQVTPDARSEEFLEFLKLVSPTMKILRTSFTTIFQNYTARTCFQFPCLQRLKIMEFVPTDDENHRVTEEQIAPYLAVIAASPYLTKLSIQGNDIAREILEGSNLKNIQKLTISSDFIHSSVLRALRKVKMDNLKKLKLDFQLSDDDDTALVRACIAQFSEKLHCLNVSLFHAHEIDEGCWESFPDCPRVTHLTLDSLSDVSHFSWDRFPNLKSVHVGWIQQERGEQEWGIDPCLSVEAVSVQSLGCDQERGRNEIFMELLQLFPNATQWKIGVTCDCVESFYQLTTAMNVTVKRLGVETTGNFSKMWNEGNLITSALQKFEELEELDLYVYGQIWTLTPRMIDFTKLPNLKVVRLKAMHFTEHSWDMNKFVRSLEEVRKIELDIGKYSSKHVWAKDLEKLFLLLPQIHLISLSEEYGAKVFNLKD